MKIIYWTIALWGLNLLEKTMYFHYTGLENGKVYSDSTLGISALVAIGIWIAGCFYFANNE